VGDRPLVVLLDQKMPGEPKSRSIVGEDPASERPPLSDRAPEGSVEARQVLLGLFEELGEVTSHSVV